MAKTYEIDGITPEMPLTACAQHIIVTRFREMMAYKTEASDLTDMEFVHDMRVASRRLRAAMDSFRDCFEKKQFKTHYKQVKTITRTMGAVRDLDVLIARFQNELLTLTETAQRDIRKLIEHLQQEREAAREPMFTLFAKLEADNFEETFLTFFQGEK